MITESLIDVLISLSGGVFSMLPDLGFDFSGFYEIVEGLSSFFEYVFYFFPMDTVFFCISIIILIQLFKIVISFLKTLWQLLPFV